MGTTAEAHQEFAGPPILFQDPNPAADNPPADSTHISPDSPRSLASAPLPASNGKDLEAQSIVPPDGKRKEAVHTSAAAFVEGGVQDACEDSCSICLEPFCESDPATVTCCKHDYHLQCILEWAQRSKDCPMCWQALKFEDPNSQELFDAIERERSPPWMRNAANGLHLHQVPAFANYADFEERIMQHLAHQLARRGRSPSMYDEPYVHSSDPSLLRPSRAFLDQFVQETRQSNSNHVDTILQTHSNHDTAGHESERHSMAFETVEESPQRTTNLDISSLSESLKSRFLVASSKWKETFTKTTHGFKEKWRARTNSNSNPVPDLRARGQVLNADVGRQGTRRIAPDNAAKDNDVPTTSSSCARSGSDEDPNKAGAQSQARCLVVDSHLDSIATSGNSHQTPGAAV